MLAGVTIVDPQTTWIEPTVEIEADVDDPSVQRCCAARPASRRAPRSAPTPWRSTPSIGRNATVGPFCYLRPGTVLGESSKAGTYVEIKNSRIGDRTKVPHLSYIGDAEIGDDTNVGAGAITANFPHRPGEPKGRTTIGSNVRTGIHNGFVAPIEVGDGAWIAAGSVITKDVPADALGIARPRQENKEGYAARQRGRLSSPFPASKAPELDDAAAPRPLDRARAAEAADGVLRPLAHRSRRAHRRAARRRARRGRAEHVPERRDLRAASTSRSAAPTSSSSRPAASPSTAT